ncbi:uncharacterized protein LOC111721658 isoform X2 [Sarcophilus harrisii]|uniref:uncharacterized protein LOC111721658 isoform X2 n=1 Tax=Sarcophilus harrisii TaxID=9305 RepID=UPI0013020741|nr:uncharacterized protein LOC111721658 isoform X2 [Sarcophilus harrisii]
MARPLPSLGEDKGTPRVHAQIRHGQSFSSCLLSPEASMPRAQPISWNLAQIVRVLQSEWPPGSPKAALLGQTLEQLLEAEAGRQEWERENKAKSAALAQFLLRLWGSSHLEPEVNMEEPPALDPKTQTQDEAADSNQALLRSLISRLLAKISEAQMASTLVRGEPWPVQRRRLRRDLGPGPASKPQGTAPLHLSRLEALGAKGRAQGRRGLPLAPTHYWPE